MRYKSRKSFVVGLIFFLSIGIMCFPTLRAILYEDRTTGLLPIIILNVIVGGFLLWTWFNTHYTIVNNTLRYRCGPFNGSIAISRIRKIETNTTMYAGFRPALAPRGLILHYDRWNDIYISPERDTEFIEALKAVHPEIEVVEKR